MLYYIILYANLLNVLHNFLFVDAVVLNERQRVAKRKLIEENRERKRQEQTATKEKHDQCFHESMTDDDRAVIDDIVCAYEQTTIKITKPYTLVSCWFIPIPNCIAYNPRNPSPGQAGTKISLCVYLL